jgi:hypothetical protein
MKQTTDELLHEHISALIDLAERIETEREMLNQLVLLICTHRFEKEHLGETTAIDEALWERFGNLQLAAQEADE